MVDTTNRTPSVHATVLVLLFLANAVASVALADDDAPHGDVQPVHERWVVGLSPVPRDLAVGDSWQGAAVIKVNPHIGYIAVHASDAGFEDRARAQDGVHYVEVDLFEQMAHAVPNDALWGSQYGPQAVQAHYAWDVTVGSTARNVCIVDSGMRYTHQDIAGERYLGGYDFVSNDNSPDDPFGHGTHVGGIAAATMDNGVGIAGVAQVGIINVRVLDGNGNGYHSDVADGIEYCADNEGHVINLSLGGSGSSVLSAAVNYAWTRDALIVAASGNDGPCSDCILYPAKYANAIAVGCVNSARNQCSFTSDGPQMELVGPGYDIVSTCKSSNSHYCTMSGTSMSAPHVSGVAALVWSMAPHMSNADVRVLLRETAADLGATGWDDRYGHGLVDARAALDAIVPEIPLETLYLEDFDDGAANDWTLSGLWHVDSQCSNPPSPASYMGYHRTNACDYDALFQRTAGTAQFDIDLSDQIDAVLRFDHRWETESTESEGDQLVVEVRETGAPSWDRLRYWDARDPNQLTWTEHEVPLVQYLDKHIQVRWIFDSADGFANAYEGWYLDNVAILGIDNLPPLALATAEVTGLDPDGDGNGTARLDGSRSYDRDADGAIVRHTWYQGDTLVGTGATSDVTLPVGTHTIVLEVQDDDGATDTAQSTVTLIENRPPSAAAGPDRTVSDVDGDGIGHLTLSDHGSTDPDGPTLTHAWRTADGPLGDGATLPATLPVGVHNVILAVTDEGGLSDEDSVTIHVEPNQAPQARAGPDQVRGDHDGDGLGSVSLDGSASSDDGTDATYAWTLDGTTLGTAAAIDVDLPIGAHAVTLRITDEGGLSDEDDVQIDVIANQPPLARASVRCLELTCVLTASDSEDDGDTLSYRWDLDDGTTAMVPDVTHEYATQGTYRACVRVTDAAGATSDACLDAGAGFVFVDEDFEDDIADGFTTTLLWHVDDRCTDAPSGTHYLAYHGTDSCHMYTGGSHSGYARTQVDLGAVGDPAMIFQHRWDTTSTTSGTPLHRQIVMVRALGETTWTYAAEWDSLDPNQLEWAPHTVDLTPWAHQVVEIQFYFSTGTSAWSHNNHPGWFIDDVGVGSLAYLQGNLPPIADAGPDIQVRDADTSGAEALTLDGSASHDPDGFLQTLTWREGTQTLGTGPTLTHDFTVGTHLVDLVVVDDEGATTTDRTVITVSPNSPPTARAGADRLVGELDGDGIETVAMDASASSDDDGTIATYTWWLNDTVVATEATPTIELPLGQHIVRLIVTDDGGATGLDESTITVRPNEAPIAIAGADRTLRDVDGTGAETVHLDGSDSHDDDTPMVTATWYHGTVAIATGFEPLVSLGVGVHDLRLEVVDTGGLIGQDALVITVLANEAPVASPPGDMEANDDDRDGAETFVVDGRGSYDPDGTIVTTRWLLGDIVLGQGAMTSVVIPVGTHVIALEVTDDGGAVTEAIFHVIVTDNRPPVAVFDITCDELVCTYDGTLSDDPDGDPLTFAWTFGDDTQATEPAGTHTYTGPGFFDVCLSVFDGSVNDTACQTLHLVATTYLQDFEGPVADWNLNGHWHVDDGCAAAPSGVHYLGFHHTLVCAYVDVPRAFGTATFTTDLSQATTAELRFTHRWVTENSGGGTHRDLMHIHVSDNGGSSWRSVALWDSSRPNQPAWSDVVIDLDARVGHLVQIRFTFDSVNAIDNLEEGWFIDDVEIVSDQPFS